MRYMFFIMLLILLALMPVAAHAQNLDGADTVRQAVRKTAAVAYRFTQESSVTQRLEGPDIEVYTDTTVSSDGAVSSADTYALTFATRVTTTQSGQTAQATLETQWTQVDGVEYLYIAPDENFQQLIKGDAGWWRYNDLLAYQDTGVGAVYLQSLASGYQPPHAEFARWLIVDAAPRDAQTLDGQTMNVFNVTLSPLTALGNMPDAGNRLEGIETLFRDLDLLLVGEFDYRAEVWIGAEDGLLHRVLSYQRTDIPFLSANLQKGPTWDSFITAQATFAFDYDGEAITVTAPESFNRPAIFP